MREYQDQELTGEILSAAVDVHKALGPGLLESAYKTCMMFEFEERGLKYKQEMIVPLVYKNRRLDAGFRIDFLIEDKIIVELKSIDHLLPIHESQVLTYLRLLDKNIGLLLNFNVTYLKNGIRRLVLNARDEIPTT